MGQRPALLIIDVQYRTVGTVPRPFWESIKEFPTSCGDVGWRAVKHIERLLAVFRGNGWPVLYPYVSPKETFDRGRLSDKVPAIMNIAQKGYEFVAEIALMTRFMTAVRRRMRSICSTWPGNMPTCCRLMRR
jgi:nicotinamidase-related amidase